MNIGFQKCKVSVSDVEINSLQLDIGGADGYDSDGHLVKKYTVALLDNKKQVIFRTEPVFDKGFQALAWGNRFLELLKDLPVTTHRFPYTDENCPGNKAIELNPAERSKVFMFFNPNFFAMTS